MKPRHRPHVVLLAATTAFIAAYYAVIALGGPLWLVDASLLLPCGAAAVLHFRRALSTPGRAAAFWRLTTIGLALWLLGQVLWTGAEAFGYDPTVGWGDSRAFVLLVNVLFVGFLAPFLGALALRPHARPGRPDAVAVADAALICGAILFAFLRLVFLPVPGAPEGDFARFFLVGLQACVLAMAAGAQWRWVRDPEWRTIYGCVCLAALAYGTLNSLASGFARYLLPPGTLVDVAWIVPFALLAAAALPPSRVPRPAFSSALIVLMAGAGPVALDGLLGVLVPALGLPFAPRPLLLVWVSAVMAAGCLARLLIEERAHALAERDERERAEESRRAGRLQALASLSASLVEDLERAMAVLVFQARAAAPFLQDKAERVLEQAQRAQEIVRGMVQAFRLAGPAHRQAVDAGLLLEDTVEQVLDDGPALHVRLEGTRRLPPVWGDPAALGVAFLHLIRNAAQASPGGRLTVSATNDVSHLTLRFSDDGPGVPPEVGPQIFDPFFTTRPVGEGVGLGLTQVHFIARDHGGAVVLEPSSSGARVALRLPVRERRTGQPVQPPWPLSVGVLVSAAVALVLAVWPTETGRVRWSEAWQVAAALCASGALARCATGGPRRTRLFWGLLALGPLLAAAPAFAVALRGAGSWARDHAAYESFLGLAVLAWVAALLVRPDRPRARERPIVAFLGGAAVLLLIAHVYAFVALLPGWLAVGDHAWRARALWGQAVVGFGLTAWAAAVFLRTGSHFWRLSYGRLSLLFGTWAAGQTIAGLGYAAAPAGGGLADLGAIVPHLMLAAFAVTQALREAREKEEVAPASADEPRWSARFWVAVALLIALEIVASSTADAALDHARAQLTRATLVGIGLLLALREAVRSRAAVPGSPQANRARSELAGAPPARLLRLVATAIYELSGHISGISTLSRLLGSHPTAGPRVREDAARVQDRAETAGRIVRNLLAALPGAATTAQRFDLNRLVDEVVVQRHADLSAAGIDLRTRLASDLPVLWLSVPAIRQVLVACLEAGALALRASGGVVEVATGADGEHVVVRVSHRGTGDAGAPPRFEGDVGLGLAREVVSQHGGTLSEQPDSAGGTEITMRLPVIAAPSGREMSSGAYRAATRRS
ncbi:MAG: HAMP domain-containing sensor histidine kinase [Vicinamibacteria bacterium]